MGEIHYREQYTQFPFGFSSAAVLLSVSMNI